MVAILKPGKDTSSPKSFRPISLLCHLYKLFKRLILHRITPTIDDKLISEQTGFRPGKSCTGQILNLAQHIEDGYERGVVTGAVFVDLSAAYNTVNHLQLLLKIYKLTKDYHLTSIIQLLLQNRRFHVVMGGKQSRWRNQKKWSTSRQCSRTLVV